MRRAVLALASSLAFAACEAKAPEPEGPIPALSRPGLSWIVTRGDKTVFTMKNEAGRIRWPHGETDHAFVSGVVSDRREEDRLRKIVKRSRHFRDLINQLQGSGYGVAPAEAVAP